MRYRVDVVLTALDEPCAPWPSLKVSKREVDITLSPVIKATRFSTTSEGLYEMTKQVQRALLEVWLTAKEQTE